MITNQPGIDAEIQRVEYEIIQGAIWAPQCWNLLQSIQPEWFEQQTHRWLWSELHLVCNANDGVFDDVPFVRGVRERHSDAASGLLELVGNISDGFAHPDHLPRYAELMRVIGARRCARLWASAIVTACIEREPLRAIRELACNPPEEIMGTGGGHD